MIVVKEITLCSLYPQGDELFSLTYDAGSRIYVHPLPCARPP